MSQLQSSTTKIIDLINLLSNQAQQKQTYITNYTIASSIIENNNNIITTSSIMNTRTKPTLENSTIINYSFLIINLITIFFNITSLCIIASKTKKTRPDYLLIFLKTLTVLFIFYLEVNLLGQDLFKIPEFDIAESNRFLISTFLVIFSSFSFQITSETISSFFDPIEVVYYLLSKVKSLLYDYIFIGILVILTIVIELIVTFNQNIPIIKFLYIYFSLDFSAFDNSEILDWVIYSFNPIVVIIVFVYFFAFLFQAIDFFRLSKELKLKSSHLCLFSCLKIKIVLNIIFFLSYIAIYIIEFFDFFKSRTKTTIYLEVFSLWFYVFLFLEAIISTLILSYSDYFYFVYGSTKLGSLISLLFCIPKVEDLKPKLNTSTLRVSKFDNEESVTYIQDVTGYSIETHQVSLINSYVDLCLNSVLRLLPQLIVLSRNRNNLANRGNISNNTKLNINQNSAKMSKKEYNNSNMFEFEFSIQDIIANKPSQLFSYNNPENSNFNNNNNNYSLSSNNKDQQEMLNSNNNYDNAKINKNTGNTKMHVSQTSPYLMDNEDISNNNIVKRTSKVSAKNKNVKSNNITNTENRNNITNDLNEYFFDNSNGKNNDNLKANSNLSQESHTKNLSLEDKDMTEHSVNVTNEDLSFSNQNNTEDNSKLKNNSGKVRIKSIYQAKLEQASHFQAKNENNTSYKNNSFPEQLELLRRAINDHIVSQPQFLLYLISKNARTTHYSDIKFPTDNSHFNIQIIENKQHFIAYLEHYIKHKQELLDKASFLEDIIAVFDFQIGNFPSRIIMITKNKFISPHMIPKDYYHMWQILRLNADAKISNNSNANAHTNSNKEKNKGKSNKSDNNKNSNKVPFTIIASSHSKANNYNTNDILASIERANCFNDFKNNEEDDDSFNSNFVKNPNDMVLLNNFKIINFEKFNDMLDCDLNFLKKLNVEDFSLSILYYELGKIETEDYYDGERMTHLPTLKNSGNLSNNRISNIRYEIANYNNTNNNNATNTSASNFITFEKFALRLSNISKNLSGIYYNNNKNNNNVILESSTDDEIIKELEEEGCNDGFACNAYKASILDYQCVLFFYIDIYNYTNIKNYSCCFDTQTKIDLNSNNKSSFLFCVWMFIDKIKSVGFFIISYLLCGFYCCRRNKISNFKNLIESKFIAAFPRVEIANNN